MTLIASRRPVRTYRDKRSGKELYADTGRAVDERLGTHVVLWIVDDPEAWAAKVEADADEAVAQRPKDRIAHQRRAQRYQNAERIRADGAGVTWYTHRHSEGEAQAAVVALYRGQPNPGVRYEVAEITAVGACPTCRQPTIQADGEWRHHAGGYPAECHQPEPAEPETPRQDGEWEIDQRGWMICGYCDQREAWPYAVLGYFQLTGYHLLGIEKATGDLVVLAEATSLAGERMVLPHHCKKIPDDVKARYRPTAHT